MRIELGQRRNNSSISHGLHINGIHIIPLDFLQYQIQFPPTVVITVELLSAAGNLDDYQCRQYANDHTEYGRQNCIGPVIHLFHNKRPPGQSTCSTSIPALRRRSTPSVSLYSSRYTTLDIPACMISFAHSRHGEAVTYNVAP